MALFGRKKATEEKVEDVKEVKATKAKTTKTPVVKAVKAKKEEVVETGKSEFSYRITEKATRLADKNVYVLNVPKTANKTELKKVLQTKYKVTVLGINIVNSPKKKKMYKNRPGLRGGGKKAYITLKAGDSIVL